MAIVKHNVAILLTRQIQPNFFDLPQRQQLFSIEKILVYAILQGGVACSSLAHFGEWIT